MEVPVADPHQQSRDYYNSYSFHCLGATCMLGCQIDMLFYFYCSRQGHVGHEVTS